MSFTLHTYGDADADIILVQMVDDHDMETIQQEAAYIRELTGGKKINCRKWAASRKSGLSKEKAAADPVQ